MSGDDATRPWAYSAFRVRVAGIAHASPGFVRMTLAGGDLRHFAPWGLDQRIKLVLPAEGATLSDGGLHDIGLLDDPTPHPSDWYARWKGLPAERRIVLRTYTPAAVRPEAGEIDVDLFLHEPAGPATRWARAATVGDEIVVTGPDVRVGWSGYGIHWTPPADAADVLLIADETAVPAVRNVLAALAPWVRAHVLLDLVDAADDLVSPASGGARVVRVPRADAVGTALLAAVDRHFDEPGRRCDYTWIAGESDVTALVRRRVVHAHRMPKDRVSFLGYWRRGGPLVG